VTEAATVANLILAAIAAAAGVWAVVLTTRGNDAALQDRREHSGGRIFSLGPR
jgi:hypothetical protein